MKTFMKRIVAGVLSINLITSGILSSQYMDYSTVFALQSTGLEITQEPEDYCGKIGETAIFKIQAEGESVSYQWQFSQDGKTWLNMGWTGSKTTEVSGNITEARIKQQYRCLVTDANGNTVISKVVKLSEPLSPVIKSSPKDYCGEVGDTAFFVVDVDGEQLSYQWQYSVDGLLWNDAGLSGNKTSSLTVPLVYCIYDI